MDNRENRSHNDHFEGRRPETNKSSFLSFSSISLSEPAISGPMAKSEIILVPIHGKVPSKNAGLRSTESGRVENIEDVRKEPRRFTLEIRYEEDIQKDHLPLLRMAFCMPLLNYGLFSEKLLLDFPLAESDLSLLNDLNTVFSRDIFVNKILRRRADYILKEFLPEEETVKPEEADPKAQIEAAYVYPDLPLSESMDGKSCGVLSSGGKESLLTYAMLHEVQAHVHPLYVNESGGHWRTALPAYRYHRETEPNTQKIWTNVDRFYNFMLDHLHFIRPDHRKVRADTYPIRLCIFPFYVFALLPHFVRKKISSLLIGSEFDDLRSQPEYLGIPHYFGIYDQHQDYDLRMNDWYARRVPGLSQWSAVRNITGLIVERILVSRYPHLAEKQRSCHSCHFVKEEIIPCGTCSKCLGVMLFLMADQSDPKMMSFRQKDIDSFLRRSDFSSLRLDQEEKDHSLFLLKSRPDGRKVDHIEKVHIDERTCNPELIPPPFRKKLFTIIEKYTSGYCELQGEKWVPGKPPDYL